MELEAHSFKPLSISFENALAAGKLPDHDDDPFDRMLIAQAIVVGLTLVTGGKNIRRYRVNSSRRDSLRADEVGRSTLMRWSQRADLNR